MEDQRECDPFLCHRCHSQVDVSRIKDAGYKIPCCSNTNLYYNLKPRIWIGKSTICKGLGLFAGESFKKHDFIGEYVGEIMNYSEASRREIIYEKLGIYYLFNLSQAKVVDAYGYGNKMKFANHAIPPIDNAIVKVKFSKGVHKIAVYAIKEIQIGEEILFDYGDKFQVKWLLDFNKKVRRMKNQLLDGKFQQSSNKNKKDNNNVDLFENQKNTSVLIS